MVCVSVDGWVGEWMRLLRHVQHMETQHMKKEISRHTDKCVCLFIYSATHLDWSCGELVGAPAWQCGSRLLLLKLLKLLNTHMRALSLSVC